MAAKLISTVRIKQQEAEKLFELAYELTVNNSQKQRVTEADIIHWILEKELDKITVEEWENSQK